MRRSRSFLVSTALLTSLAVTGSGCFGTFALTRRVYEFNKGVSSNRYVQTLVMWAFCIIPIYGLAGTVDIVILNLIEFWTGSNPLALKPGETVTRELAMGGKQLRLTLGDQGQSLRVAEVVDGEEMQVRWMVPDAQGGILVRDDFQHSVARVSDLDGSLVLEDSSGDVIDTSDVFDVTGWIHTVARELAVEGEPLRMAGL